MSSDPIRQLVHRYSDAVVRRDAAQWASTWAEDAVWEIGQDRRVAGREAIVALWTKAMDRYAALVQNAVNGTSTLDADTGTGEGRCYIIEHWQRADDTRGILLAYYDDRYTRVDGEWLFASRELVMQYNGPADLSGAFLNAQV